MSLKNQLETNAMMFHQLIRKICNSSTALVIENVIGITLELLHSYILNKGDEYNSLLKYLETSYH